MPMDPSRLWAKSRRDGEEFSESMLLPQHLKDVHAAAGRVLDTSGDDQLAALGLDIAAYRERLRRCVLLAAAVHELGKANDHFQGMILGRRAGVQQGLRHEWVTILLLQIPDLKRWLLPAVGDRESDLALVEWAVAGHHPAYDRPSPPRAVEPGVGTTVRLLTDHRDFRASLDWIARSFGLSEPPPVLPGILRPLIGAGNVFLVITDWFRTARRTWEATARNPERRLVAAVKNTLIAADVAGSAIPRTRPADAEWWRQIEKALANKPSQGELHAAADLRLAGNEPRDFQGAVRDSDAPVTFVKAGCGSGKTLAAYLWAARNYPTRRLYFCYPTTGTATEGFRDYLNPGSEEFHRDATNAERVAKLEADLFHSRADVDWELILTTGPDADRPVADAALRAEALEAWSTPVVACTVDTVLGLVQNNKRGLFAWPALAQAAFVFDEIHAYDDRLFGALLRFLRDVPGVPALLMTASLPVAREQALRRLATDRGIELPMIPGPRNLEELPRYVRHPDADPIQVVRAVAKSEKVLWVCNTVGRVMGWAERAEEIGLKPLLYHSRFKYEGRVERHKAVIDAFKCKGPALAICSQVAEMSLDLSATVLVTDLAPVPALIQRLGRLNRRAKSQADEVKPFLVVEPDNHLPYTPADLAIARDWLSRLPVGAISQRQLAASWEQKEEIRMPAEVASAWLDGGPSTTVLELREPSPGITVLMEEDLSRIRAGVKAARLALPMPPPPRSLNWRAWRQERGIPIAPAGTIEYHPERGGKWAEPAKPV